MLTDMQLKALKPAEKIYKVSDQRGMYVAVTRTGVASFRFDYRLNGRRETLVIGQYDSSLGMRKPIWARKQPLRSLWQRPRRMRP